MSTKKKIRDFLNKAGELLDNKYVSVFIKCLFLSGWLSGAVFVFGGHFVALLTILAGASSEDALAMAQSSTRIGIIVWAILTIVPFLSYFVWSKIPEK